MPRKTYAEFTPEEKAHRLSTQNAYLHKTHTQYFFRCHNVYDADIIDKLNGLENKVAYIKSLIRADIAKETEE